MTGGYLFACEDLGAYWPEIDFIGSTIKKNDLGIFYEWSQNGTSISAADMQISTKPGGSFYHQAVRVFSLGITILPVQDMLGTWGDIHQLHFSDGGIFDQLFRYAGARRLLDQRFRGPR